MTRAAANPDTVLFCANFRRLQITVHGTGHGVPSVNQGVKVISDKIIKFRRGQFAASKTKKYKLFLDDYDDEGKQAIQMVTEVEFLESTPHFTGGCMGARIWHARGDEGPVAALEAVLRPLGENEEPPSPRQIIKIAKAAARAEDRANRKHGPDVHTGLRQSLLPDDRGGLVDPPDDFEGDYDVNAQSAGLTEAPDGDDVRASLRSLADTTQE